MNYPVDLTPYVNSVIATSDGDRRLGGLNAWGNSLPADELPFGSTIQVDAVMFRLPSKARSHSDNVEPLGQCIALADRPVASGIAFLGCGEMGDQYLTARIISKDCDAIRVSAVAKAAMVLPQGVTTPDGLELSHLHYPGDYELSLITGAVWCFQYHWRRAVPVEHVMLDSNPLVHLLALTLVA